MSASAAETAALLARLREQADGLEAFVDIPHGGFEGDLVQAEREVEEAEDLARRRHMSSTMNQPSALRERATRS